MSDNILEKYSELYWSPFLTWVFMWINAIKDVALFVDWPDCVFYKADMLYKTHDLFSDLKQPNINTKLYFSWVMPNKMIRGYDEKIKRKLQLIEQNKKFNLWVVTCMPVTWLLATQYNNLYDDFLKDFIFVPSYTDKFRIDWYSLLLRELAKKIKLNTDKKKKKHNISIIWYLFDRNEWDCIGNIEEIKRILWLIWVKVDSIWLDWWNYKDLFKIENSELLVSLPYWKYASKILKRRLDIDILELDVPFWLKNTINFINFIWEKLWIDKEIIKNIVNKELKQIKEKINLLDEKKFLNKNYVYAWDPHLKNSIIDIWNFLWMNYVNAYSYIWTRYPTKKKYNKEKVDLLIWNSDFDKNIEIKMKLEFWFPSYNTHFLTNRSYMWFNGVLNFVERLYFELSKNEK